MSFNKMTQKRLLFIADEAHNMGAGRILDRLNGIKYLRRIGLSATPERQYDDVGNKAVMNFFGCEKLYFEYSMRDAIEWFSLQILLLSSSCKTHRRGNV